MAETMRDRIERVIAEMTEINSSFDVINPAAIADAVLAEMLEPTEAMLNAARSVGEPPRVQISDRIAIEVWQAMIDAASKGTPQ